MAELLTQAQTTLDQLTGQLARIAELVEEKQQLLNRLSRSIDLSSLDREALQAFLDRPYILRPLGEDRHELYIPKFLAKDFHPGWPLRVDGEYIVYAVSRFIDLVTPLPDWLKTELHYEQPDFQGHINHLNGNQLVVTSGDAAEVWNHFGGRKTFSARRGDTLWIRPKSRFQLFRDLVRSGILPYRPERVPKVLLRAPQTTITLRPHQERDFQKFLEWGAVAVIAPGGGGKTFFGLYALASITGRKIVFAPRLSILEQWRARLAAFCPDIINEVEFRTYQSMHNMKLDRIHPYDLIIYDEIQQLPSNTGVLAAQIPCHTRIGLSATPWREDSQEDLIIALAGYPLGFDWPSGQPPETTIWITDTEADKMNLLHRIIDKPVTGKTMIFVYRLNEGNLIANELDIPFVHGETRDQLQVMRESKTFVVSKVADAGISLNDVSRVIEYDRLGGRTELGQRGLRLRHGDNQGEFHVLMSRQEYQTHSRRLAALYALNFDVRMADL